MATWTNNPERNELRLRSIEAMLEELPNLVNDWPTISRDEQLAWSHEWDNEMANLRRVAEGAEAGRLNRHEQQRFRTLAERTVRLLPLVEQIDLLRPADVVLEAGQARVSP